MVFYISPRSIVISAGAIIGPTLAHYPMPTLSYIRYATQLQIGPISAQL